MKARTSGTLLFVPDEDCGGIKEVVSGEGNATHFGNFTVHLEGCIGGLISGYQIAANGDKIITQFLYPGVDENGQFIVFGYEGGTGRFENALGEIKLYITLTPDPDYPWIAHFENYGEGWISY